MKLTRRDFLKLAGGSGVGLLAASSNLLRAASVLAQEPITVRFLTVSWASTTDRRAARQVAFSSVIDSFNDQYADQGIQVEEIVGDGNPITITQEITNGNIDVFWTNINDYRGRVEAGQLAPIEGAEEEQFFPWIIDFLRDVDGNLYALQHQTGTRIHAYNSSIIETPPTNWSELRAIAERVREDTNGDMYGYMPSLNLMLWAHFAEYIALGGTVLEEDGTIAIYNDTNQQIMADWFSFYRGLLDDDLIPEAGDLPDVFAGRVASFSWNDNVFTRELEPNLPPDEIELWQAVPQPMPDNVDPVHQAGGWIVCPVANPEDVAREMASVAFTLHATAFRALRDTNKAGGWVPPRIDVIEGDPFFSESKGIIASRDALLSGGWTAPGAAFTQGDWWTPMQVAFSSMVSGNLSPEDAVAQAASEFPGISG